MGILCARETQRSIDQSIKKLLDNQIPRMGFGPLNGDGFYESLKSEIRGRNGTVINFAGLRTNVDSIRSTENIDLCYVSEARTVSKNSIRVLTPTVRNKGSEIWWDYNPVFASDPVDEMFVGGTPPPGSIIKTINYIDNPWFPEELRQEMEWDRRRDIDTYRHIWLGEYQKASQSRVFKNWRVDDFDTPSDAEFHYGADWGYANDPTTLVRIFLGRMEAGRAVFDPKGRTLFFDYEAYKVGCEIDATPELFDTVPDARKWTIRADSARPETISYMNRHGFKVAAAAKGAGSVQDGVSFMQSYDIVVHPRCAHVETELSRYSWKVDPVTEEILPVLADKENHLLDAARYALESTRKASYALGAWG